MLFKRYSDPLSLMSTYSMKDLGGFLVQAFNKQNEEELDKTLWELWLSSDKSTSFKDFKDEQVRAMKQGNKKPLTEEEEKRNIESAMKFIKPI